MPIKLMQIMVFTGSKLWHLDGYDKLKPYGFAIHGYIDGYIIMVQYSN